MRDRSFFIDYAEASHSGACFSSLGISLGFSIGLGLLFVTQLTLAADKSCAVENLSFPR
jgi:hypothetical protein